MDRIPPHDQEAEQSVLGAMLIEREAILTVAELLEPADFYRAAHQKIYEAVIALDGQGEPVDLVTLAEELERRKMLGEVGGTAYLSKLAGTVPTAANVQYYAKIVREKADRRRLILSATEAMRKAYDPGSEVLQTVTELEGNLLNLTTAKVRLQDSSIYPEIADVWEGYIDNRDGKAPDLLTTGFADLDWLIGGWIKGEHIIVAARPSLGKTSLSLCFARNIAHTGRRSVFFSLEQPRDEILKKIIAQESLINYQGLDFGQLTELEKERVWERIDKIYGLNMGVLDGRWSVPEIRRRAIQEKREKGLDCLLVDFLTKLQPAGKFEKLSYEINDNAKQLEDLSVELKIPVITMAQLNRDVEKRTNRRPLLSDIREAGEEYASKVIFIYRDEFYYPDSKEKGIAEIIVGKNRRGPIGTVKMAWIGHATVFENLRRE